MMHLIALFISLNYSKPPITKIEKVFFLLISVATLSSLSYFLEHDKVVRYLIDG